MNILVQAHLSRFYHVVINVIFISTCYALSFLVDCQWGEYSAWSACTTTCGAGKQYKFRVIQTYETNGGLACDANKNVEEQDCNPESCPGPGKPCNAYCVIEL